MKNRLRLVLLIAFFLVSLTGCGNDHIKTLSCLATNSENGLKTKSDLKITIKDNQVEDMELTLNVVLPDGEQSYKQAMMSQMRQKTSKVYSTKDGIKAIFGMGSSYFDAFGITKDASYNELKQVLELQGYTCKD